LTDADGGCAAQLRLVVAANGVVPFVAPRLLRTIWATGHSFSATLRRQRCPTHWEYVFLTFICVVACWPVDSANDRNPLHVVSAWATEHHFCLGQLAVDSKCNEITAIPQLLKLLELKGALVTIDATGCQKEIAWTM
jgi:hypothetical protein